MSASNATTRFSSRVQTYVRYRPGYPAGVIELMRSDCGLLPEHVIADVASGTGLFTRLLLENGNRVFAIEPNDDMRAAGEDYLRGASGWTSIRGTAEATTLPACSVDFVTAAQAAHWFNRSSARQEFVRILKPAGWCVLIWNERCTDSTPFLREYEQLLLDYAIDYKEVRHERTTNVIHEFFSPCPYEERAFDYRQEFDYDGLKGRLLSSSYAPLSDHPNHEPMIEELRRMYEQYESGGRVWFEYKTRVFYGRLEPGDRQEAVLRPSDGRKENQPPSARRQPAQHGGKEAERRRPV